MTVKTPTGDGRGYRSDLAVRYEHGKSRRSAMLTALATGGALRLMGRCS
jgi:hypothetical protein